MKSKDFYDILKKAQIKKLSKPKNRLHINHLSENRNARKHKDIEHVSVNKLLIFY